MPKTTTDLIFDVLKAAGELTDFGEGDVSKLYDNLERAVNVYRARLLTNSRCDAVLVAEGTKA